MFFNKKKSEYKSGYFVLYTNDRFNTIDRIDDNGLMYAFLYGMCDRKEGILSVNDKKYVMSHIAIEAIQIEGKIGGWLAIVHCDDLPKALIKKNLSELKIEYSFQRNEG